MAIKSKTGLFKMSPINPSGSSPSQPGCSISCNGVVCGATCSGTGCACACGCACV